jgi:hypothetical protein
MSGTHHQGCCCRCDVTPGCVHYANTPDSYRAAASGIVVPALNACQAAPGAHGGFINSFKHTLNDGTHPNREYCLPYSVSPACQWSLAEHAPAMRVTYYEGESCDVFAFGTAAGVTALLNRINDGSKLRFSIALRTATGGAPSGGLFYDELPAGADYDAYTFTNRYADASCLGGVGYGSSGNPGGIVVGHGGTVVVRPCCEVDI